ncbi:amino acid adenylation domain-containing protein [Erwinia endophytica]|uniref:non-ribosomal peptide synthetase n=1 Tax=Erwinia endophytica TaxID=1563158 RepID=UPI001266049D|nr:non-ribosomal peptide synthetase [Erwinia endophytica]KAB8307492.1 amino acid adenylation domain-containing protein [Erwinia endophytica]
MALSNKTVQALTEGQKEIWIAQKMTDDSSRYNTAECIRIKGGFSADCFKQAVFQVIRQIETLNCSYELQQGELVQIMSGTDNVNYQFLDFSHDKQPERNLQEWMQYDIRQPVDLRNGPLYCLALIQLAEDEFCWYQRVHHIALDGFGVAMVLRQIADTYNHLQQGMASESRGFTPLNYLLAKEQAYRNSEQWHKDEEFWKNYCQRLPTAPRLSPIHCEVADTVRREQLLMPAEQFVQMNALAKKCRVSWIEVWLAIFAGYVAWKTREQGIVLGFPFMNRNDGALFKLPAMMVNILPLSIPVSPDDDIASLAKKIRQEIEYVKPHTQYRGMQLLRLREDNEPLFGPVVNVLPFYESLELHGATGVIENVHGGPVDDCALRVVPSSHAENSDLLIHIDANPGVYPADELLAICKELAHWSCYWLAHPQNSMAKLEQHQWYALADYLIHSRETGTFIWQDVISRIRQQALRTPEAIALETDSVRISYQSLVKQFDTVSGELMARGTQQGEVVAVFLPRTAETIVIMLGIVAAGASCFVLDTSSPDERLQQALEACNTRYVIIAERQEREHTFGVETLLSADLLMNTAGRMSPRQAILPETISFIIFTSGSTGQPKGVAIPHRALSWFVDAAGQTYDIRQNDKILQFSSLTFDACLEEIFIPLCRGACVVLRTEEMAASLAEFLAYVTEHAITVLDLPTTFWHTLTLTLSVQSHVWPATVRTLIVGGEAISQQRLSQWKSLMGERIRLINTYGPTEGTIVFTCKVLAGEGFDPTTSDLRSIGLPLAGLRCLILDAAQCPVRPGRAGELYLIGPTLSSGYINSVAMTRESFVTLKCGEETIRAYKTGDWVTLTEQGEIVYLGRIDKQVKFRGYRVDLNEIRDCCLAVPGVKEARAVMRQEDNGQLILYVQLADGAAVDCQRIATHLQHTLPQYMQPNQIIPLSEFPLTRSGKIDEKKLPKLQTPVGNALLEQGESDFERAVVDAWKNELSLDYVGIHQDFYALGGSSLNLFSVHARLLNQGVSIAPKLLLENRTVHQLYLAWQQSMTEQQSRIPGLELIVKLQHHQRKHTLWTFHPYSGRVDCYRTLAERLEPQFDIMAFQAPYLTGPASEFNTLFDLAKHYRTLLRHEQKEGPYYLLGYSLGGNIAWLVAQLLSEEGQKVSYLGLLDCRSPQYVEKMENPLYTMVKNKLGHEYLDSVRRLDEETQLSAIAGEMLKQGAMRFMTPEQLISALRFSFSRGTVPPDRLRPLTISGRAFHYGFTVPGEEWRELITDRLSCHQFIGEHDTLMDELMRSGAMQIIQQDLALASTLD